MYSPEYAIRDLTEVFEQLAKEGKLPEDVNAYLHEAWKEIEELTVSVYLICILIISTLDTAPDIINLLVNICFPATMRLLFNRQVHRFSYCSFQRIPYLERNRSILLFDVNLPNVIKTVWKIYSKSCIFCQFASL